MFILVKKQSNIVNILFSFFFILSTLRCAPTKLNGACDPESENFLFSALLEFGSTDGAFLCPLFSGLNPLRLDYGTDFLVIKQGEPIENLKPFVSEPIDHCESTPPLPPGIILNDINCEISGTSTVGLNATKYLITAKNQNKQISTSLVIKSLFVPKFVFVANVGSNLINSYTIDTTTGALNATGFVAAGGGPESMAISPNQKYLTIANRNTNNISHFSINQTNGNLNLIETVSSGGNTPISVNYHPTKDLIYIRNSDNFSTFSLNPPTGNLILINTVPTPYASSYILVDHFGNFLYETFYNGNLIGAYRIDMVTGLLSPNPIQTIPTDIRPKKMAFHANGKTLYASYDTSNNISTFQIDTNTGYMSSVFPQIPSTGVVSGSIATDPLGRFLYMTNRDTNTISMYATSPLTGELFPLSPNTVATGTEPLGITVDPSGKFLYNTNIAVGTAGIFVINQSNGILTPNGNVGTSTSPAVILTAGTNP
ncbi:lactonase family protein [Leptospira meyeri]|uniref:lactonase family protein n=1 Tax=Leptospira meyeri TaxID=29508 RepID=UPI0010847B93|nr:beta-propeller fold lactonase family protein [Leptospira meyeri]TGM22548.1 3-carboxymuconate cyclase [Leptospira meyeri]